LEDELKKEFNANVELIASEGGVYEVVVDGKNIFSKKALSRFPDDGEIITSPMVGTLYSSPSPDSPPFVKVGDKVKRGDVLCILEAMKIMNELEAEYDCKILDILAGNGEAVEYGKPLFVVERI